MAMTSVQLTTARFSEDFFRDSSRNDDLYCLAYLDLISRVREDQVTLRRLLQRALLQSHFNVKPITRPLPHERYLEGNV